MTEERSKFILAGFILGITGTGTTISAGLLSLIIVLNKVAQTEFGVPSLSSQLMIALCGLVFVMGLIVLLGAFEIWKLSAKGGAINFGVGMVLLALSQGMLILLSDFVNSNTQMWGFLSGLYYMMGIAATLSGILGVGAYLAKSK